MRSLHTKDGQKRRLLYFWKEHRTSFVPKRRQPGPVVVHRAQPAKISATVRGFRTEVIMAFAVFLAWMFCENSQLL